MAIALRPLQQGFAVEIQHVDVRRLDDATFAEIVEAFEEHSVLLFRGQAIDDEAQIAFSRRFGPLETTIRTIASQARTLPEISNLANVDAEDRLIPAGDQRNLFNAGNCGKGLHWRHHKRQRQQRKGGTCKQSGFHSHKGAPR